MMINLNSIPTPKNTMMKNCIITTFFKVTKLWFISLFFHIVYIKWMNLKKKYYFFISTSLMKQVRHDNKSLFTFDMKKIVKLLFLKMWVVIVSDFLEHNDPIYKRSLTSIRHNIIGKFNKVHSHIMGHWIRKPAKKNFLFLYFLMHFVFLKEVCVNVINIGIKQKKKMSETSSMGLPVIIECLHFYMIHHKFTTKFF